MDGISGLFISRPWRPQTRKYQSSLSHVSLTDGKMCLEYKQILSHSFFLLKILVQTGVILKLNRLTKKVLYFKPSVMSFHSKDPPQTNLSGGRSNIKLLKISSSKNKITKCSLPYVFLQDMFLQIPTECLAVPIPSDFSCFVFIHGLRRGFSQSGGLLTSQRNVPPHK